MRLHVQEDSAVSSDVSEQQGSCPLCSRRRPEEPEMKVRDLPIVEHWICANIGLPTPHAITEPGRHIFAEHQGPLDRCNGWHRGALRRYFD